MFVDLLVMCVQFDSDEGSDCNSHLFFILHGIEMGSFSGLSRQDGWHF